MTGDYRLIIGSEAGEVSRRLREPNTIHLMMGGDLRTFDRELAFEHPENTCKACGARLDDMGLAFSQQVDNRGRPVLDDQCKARPCDNDADGPCEQCSDNGLLPHDPTPVPLAWCNSAEIVLDPDEDQISVRISVADPRGSVAMTIQRKHSLNSDGQMVSELRLSVPHPEDSAPHVTLDPITNRGYYRIH
jgi:hypothetical protein